MTKVLIPIQSEIQHLAQINVTEDMLSKVDISSLIPKISEVVANLDAAKGSLDNLTKKGAMELWWGSVTGANDSTIANAEKTLIESTKMNIGLVLLTTLYAKAIKEQQHVLQEQQHILLEQNQKIQRQQENIERLWGISSEQAERIISVIQDSQLMINEVEERMQLLFQQEQEQVCDKLQKQINRNHEELIQERKLLQEQLSDWKDENTAKISKMFIDTKKELIQEHQEKIRTIESESRKKLIWWIGGSFAASMLSSYLLDLFG